MNRGVSTQVELLDQFEDDDLEALCEATNQAILDGNGFGWLKPPRRAVLESYWKGVLLVPERELYVARLDGQIVGSAQLVKPARNNEARAHQVELSTFFVAPWARGLGLARGLLRAVEEAARAHGFHVVDLDVRATQTAAIQLYEEAGFERWAVKPKYARVDDQYVDGYFYTLDLTKPAKARARRNEAAAAEPTA
ncbi:MAG: GNAT family N-acetyltransferase [Minwuiales bacterium]|nr:GNAT family N-acetyltransferase [Minwuiales bacterium]